MLFIYCIMALGLTSSLSCQCPYLAAQHPPHAQGSSILFGDFPEIQNNIVEFMYKLLHDYHEPIVELDIPCPSIVGRYFAILSPSTTQKILLHNRGAFTKGGIEQRIEKTIFYPEGLLWMPANERWKSLNTALFNGPFNPHGFPNCYGHVFHENTLWFIDRLSQLPQPFDLYRECTYYATRTMTHALFNYILTDDELVTIVDAFTFIRTFMNNRETSIVTLPVILPLPDHRLFNLYKTRFTTILKKIIEQAPYSVTHNGITYPTILGILTTHRDPSSGKHLTDEEIMSHAATLFFAGHTTTAIFTTMLIYNLSMHPAWYYTIQDELQQKYTDRSVNWIPLGALKNYTNFKNEVLRLFSPLPLISVDTTKDIVVDGYLLPKHSTLIIPIDALHKHPDFYKNPTSFNPNRFNIDDPDYTPQTETLLSFDFGHRRCLGQWFAQAEAQHLITHLINKNITFTIEPHSEPVKLLIELTGLPDQTILASIQRPNRNYSEPLCTDCYAIQDIPLQIISMRYENEAKTIKTYRLAPMYTKKLPFSYHAGDHIDIVAKNNFNQTVVRNFSISSSPTDSDEWLEITVKKESASHTYIPVSSFMHEELTEHDIVFVRAPMDDGINIISDQHTDQPLVLIAGGIGITPFMSILRSHAAQKKSQELYCIYTCKTKEECAFYEEINTFNEDSSHIHTYITFTQEPLASFGILPSNHYQGRVSSTLLDTINIPNLSQATIYICGKEEMCRDIQQLLQTMYAVPATSIHRLAFGSTIDQSTARYYTKDEVAQHATRDDAWIIIEGIIYDITSYIDKHTGFDIILDYLGTDCTNAFNETPHSAQAKKLLYQSNDIHMMGYLEL